MKGVLFKKEWKSNYKILLIFLALLTMYCCVITTMYDPDLGESLKMMEESMPELFAAFHMENPGSTMLEFLINYLYGFIVVVIPMIFILMLANKLVTKYVDKGSMAYLLTTGNGRKNIIVNQAIFLLQMIALVTVYITAACMIFSAVLFPEELDYKKFLILNLGLFALLFFFGGVCFFLACNLNESGKMLGIGGGILVWSVAVQMLSGVGDKVEWIKYLTPLTLFVPNDLVVGETKAVIGVVLLLAIGVAGFVGGSVSFCKRDLFL